jgi:hypothetical protein
VVIPYAKDIAEFITRTGSLPIASRRAFKRVLATIKTIALIHQRQRSRDDQGRVAAEYADYALAYQLTGDSFRESLGEGHRYTDDRIRLIEKKGPITPKALSEKFGISGAAVTQWMRPWIEKGVLEWCNINGAGFTDIAELGRAKRIGQAFVKVAERPCLPSPYQLTGDYRWDSGGDLWELFDLCIEENESDVKDAGDHVHGDTGALADENFDTSFPDKGVKALSEKAGSADNFQKDGLDSEMVPVGIDALSEEFAELLQMN